MENITIGQIVGALGTITIFIGFIAMINKWYKSSISDKFERIDNRLEEVEYRLVDVEKSRKQYEKEVECSKFERKILLRGELAALKGIYEIKNIDTVANSIKEIEEYIMEKSHD